MLKIIRVPLFTPAAEPRLIEGRIRLARQNEAIHININGETFLAYSSQAVASVGWGASRGDWVLVPAQNNEHGMKFFTRLCSGDVMTIDGEPKKGLLARLKDEDRVPARPPRGLFIGNPQGDLILEPLSPAATVQVSLPARDSEPATFSQSLDDQSAAVLVGLKNYRDIYGEKFEPLEKTAALSVLKAVNKQMVNEKWRPRDEGGLTGGVLELPESIQPIILGDMHGNLDNLLKILTAPGVRQGLETGKSCLLFLGDLLHPEDGDLENMDSTFLLLDVILKLKENWPHGVFVLRGNHESFSPEIIKQGIPQGMMLEEQVIKKRGRAYRDELARYFELLPYIARSQDFIACHAAPTRTQVSYETLVNLRKFPGHAYEITRNRILKPGFPAGYTKGNVKRFRKSVKVEKRSAFFVGHTPLSEDKGFWLNVQGVKNHHIVYSAGLKYFAVFTRINGRFVPLEFKSGPMVQLANED